MVRTALLTVIAAVLPLAGAAQTAGPGGAIPVVANLPGVGGTFWQSDVSIVNLDPQPTSVTLTLIPEIRDGGQTFDPMVEPGLSIPAGGQLTLRNVVQSTFGLIDAKGALSVVSTDGASLVLASRTFTSSLDGGTYGQDVHGVLVGRRAWLAGLRHDAAYRTNVGVYLPVDPLPGSETAFEIVVRDSIGLEVGRGTFVFPAAGVIQRSLSALGVGMLLDGQVQIECSDPSIAWYAYGSRVDQVTGDAVYRAAKGLASDLPAR